VKRSNRIKYKQTDEHIHLLFFVLNTILWEGGGAQFIICYQRSAFVTNYQPRPRSVSVLDERMPRLHPGGNEESRMFVNVRITGECATFELLDRIYSILPICVGVHNRR